MLELGKETISTSKWIFLSCNSGIKCLLHLIKYQLGSYTRFGLWELEVGGNVNNRPKTGTELNDSAYKNVSVT
ncbi:hypothetical protein AQUCO_00300526v1 [Aquilegia coerulea]|uniref:Uncharacterized protein n=1 Tax=Aquilegia coerulea TaxID=218851 RepID=A0A2G5EZ72_AQUCA|nr:hypothetical protein AQUCO_00300526v1 [Aquilegia coerulea]